MSYYFTHHETLEEGLRRIGREQIQHAIDALQNADMPLEDRIHKTRKHGKKIRALLRLLRPGLEEIYQEENAAIRDACKLLSPLRDAQAMQQNLSKLIDNEAEVLNCEALQNFAERLNASLEDRAKSESHEDSIEKARSIFVDALERVDAWVIEDSPADALHAGLKKTCKRGRMAMNNAYDEPTGANFHEWRKRAKYHLYHVRLLRHAWRPLLTPLLRELQVISTFLGEEHDMTVLLEHLDHLEKAGFDEKMAQPCRAYFMKRRQSLREEIRPLALRVYCEKPEALATRIHAYYQIWMIQS